MLLIQLLWQWGDRHFLRGPFGMYPDWLFARELPFQRTPSFFDVRSELTFDLLYSLTIAVAVLNLVGWKARWTGIWLYVLIWSLFHRNPMLLTGGEKLLLAIFPYVLLLDTGARFSVESWRAREDSIRARPFAALVHNAGVLCIMMQVSIAYGVAGLTKLAGERWRDGSAVSLVLQTPEFTWPGVSDLLVQQDLITRSCTYAILAFELTFPVLVWSSRTRWAAQLGAVAFHLAVGSLMGLTLFAIQALVVQLVIADDRWYERVWGWTVRRARPGWPPARLSIRNVKLQ